jgi:invasion protein IalB
MRISFSALTFVAALTAAGVVVAQETSPAEAPAEPAESPAEAPAEAPAEGPADAPAEAQTDAPGIPGMSMGTPVAPDGNAVGSTYVRSEHGDWDLRCIRTQDGNDPCQLYQLLEDENGNSVAEFVLFPLVPAQGEAVAGGTIITPLETLLTPAVTLGVDQGEARRYPFTFCTEIGCVARIGFTQPDIDRFKRGRAGIVSIVPAVAPDQRITLEVSLTGFTAGWDSVVASTTANAQAADE